MAGHFRHRALFIGPNARAAVNEGRADYVPVFLSDVPRLFESGALPLDVVFVNATPPDAHGFCSLGTSVEAMHAAIRAAKTVVVQLNRSMPRTLGDSFIHVDDIDLGVEVDVPPYAHANPIIGDVEERIGAHVAALVPDRATLQLGIGAIPAATAMALMDKRDLGIHTEMFTDAVVDLVEAGVVTGAAKERNRGKIVTSFLMGSPRLYAFVHDNPMVEMRPVDFTNDTHVIRSFSRMVSINSAIEVDLTGQVVADSIGHTMYSGVGGQMDFIRGAGLASRRPFRHRPAVDRRRRDRLADRRCPAGGRGRRHDPGPRPHGGHRVGRRRAVRQEPARAGQGIDRDRPSGLPGRPPSGCQPPSPGLGAPASGRMARAVATNGAGWRENPGCTLLLDQRRADVMPIELLVAGFLLAHAAIHVGFIAPPPPATADGPTWPFAMDRAWPVTRFGLDAAVMRSLALGPGRRDDRRLRACGVDGPRGPADGVWPAAIASDPSPRSACSRPASTAGSCSASSSTSPCCGRCLAVGWRPGIDTSGG